MTIETNPRKQVTNADPLLSIAGSAEYVGGISPHTIRFYLKEHKLRRVKIGARTFIRQSELDRFIRNGEEAAQ